MRRKSGSRWQEAIFTMATITGSFPCCCCNNTTPIPVTAVCVCVCTCALAGLYHKDMPPQPRCAITACNHPLFTLSRPPIGWIDKLRSQTLIAYCACLFKRKEKEKKSAYEKRGACHGLISLKCWQQCTLCSKPLTPIRCIMMCVWID